MFDGGVVGFCGLGLFGLLSISLLRLRSMRPVCGLYTSMYSSPFVVEGRCGVFLTGLKLSQALIESISSKMKIGLQSLIFI